MPRNFAHRDCCRAAGRRIDLRFEANGNHEGQEALRKQEYEQKRQIAQREAAQREAAQREAARNAQARQEQAQQAAAARLAAIQAEADRKAAALRDAMIDPANLSMNDCRHFNRWRGQALDRRSGSLRTDGYGPDRNGRQSLEQNAARDRDLGAGERLPSVSRNR